MIIPTPKLDRAYTKLSRASDKIQKAQSKHIPGFYNSPEYRNLTQQLDDAIVKFRKIEQEFRKTYQEKYSKELAKLNLKYQVDYTYIAKRKARAAKKKVKK